MSDDDQPKTLKDALEDLKKFAESIGTPLVPNHISDPLLRKVMEPMPMQRRITLGTPLRNRIDYQSVARKALVVDELGYQCGKCGFWHENSKYTHSDEECAIYGVMES